MIPVLIGTALALFALGYVLYPLFREEVAPGKLYDAPRIPRGQASTEIDALREIEFDHATGKLSDYDYNELKASYTARAVASMRNAAPSEGASSNSASAVQSSNAVFCPSCGPRPEGNAAFCSECGRALTL